MSSTERIARNTLILYLRLILVSGISLYTVRVVLNTLGVEDFGIYHAVGGLVALCAFLPGSLASATQRYFSFALGENDYEKLNKNFTVNLVLYIAIALIALLLLESAGLWFVNEYLRVPPERFEVARQPFRFLVFVLFTVFFLQCRFAL